MKINASDFICDSCKSSAFGQLSMHFWYGSEKDMNQASIHLCDKCADKAMNALRETLAIKITLHEITEL